MYKLYKGLLTENKMSATPRKELSLPMDWEFIDACSGFTFDIGGSVVKLAYISADDWLDPKDRKQGSKGTVRLINFSREEINEAYGFIEGKVKLKRNSQDQLIDVFSTGVGGSQFAEGFKKRLNVKTTNLTEMDCFIQAFMHTIKYVARKDLLEPVHKPAFEQAQKEADDMMAMSEKMQNVTQGFGVIPKTATLEFPQLEEKWNKDEPMKEDQLFPCLMVMCGSGFGFMVVNEDGTFLMIDGSGRGGRMFLGLGSLLTKAKSYDELIGLCERGHGDKVTTTSKHLSDSMASDKADNEQDIYDMFLGEDVTEELIFFFGEAVGKDIGDFKREDIARSLLDTIILDLVQSVHITAKGRGIKHVFFCGGFVTYPLTRQRIYTEWLKRDTGCQLFDPCKQGLIQAHFLTHGQSLGAIGALMNHHLKWSENNKATEDNNATDNNVTTEKDKADIDTAK